MPAVAWHDLLGIPYELHGTGKSGMDCSTLAEEVLRRLGCNPPATSPFRTVRSAGERGEMASYFGYLEKSFTKLGEDLSDATQAGDLVLTRDESGVARHLYVLVEPSRGTFLTAGDDCGVIALRRFVIRNRAGQEVAGVYRANEGSSDD